MPVTDEQVAALRAYLRGDAEEYDRRMAGLDEDARRGWAVLLGMAFFRAVELRMATATPEDVVEFVGNLRTKVAGAREEVDPVTAERLILFALGREDSMDGVDNAAITDAQSYVLEALLADWELDDEGLDRLLAEARELADGGGSV